MGQRQHEELRACSLHYMAVTALFMLLAAISAHVLQQLPALHCAVCQRVGNELKNPKTTGQRHQHAKQSPLQPTLMRTPDMPMGSMSSKLAPSLRSRPCSALQMQIHTNQHAHDHGRRYRTERLPLHASTA